MLACVPSHRRLRCRRHRRLPTAAVSEDLLDSLSLFVEFLCFFIYLLLFCFTIQQQQVHSMDPYWLNLIIIRLCWFCGRSQLKHFIVRLHCSHIPQPPLRRSFVTHFFFVSPMIQWIEYLIGILSAFQAFLIPILFFFYFNHKGRRDGRGRWSRYQSVKLLFVEFFKNIYNQVWHW